MTEETKQPWKVEQERRAAINAMPGEEYDKMMETKFPGMLGDVRCGFSVPQGWQALVHDLCAKLDYLCRTCGTSIVVDQVKEKFAGLRFYYHQEAADDDVSDEDAAMLSKCLGDVIHQAERTSEYTCELCGEDGQCAKVHGWMHTLCTKHAKEYLNEAG